MIHFEGIHLFLEHLAKLRNRHTFIFRVGRTAAGIKCSAQEVCNGYAGDGNRILKCQKDAFARAILRDDEEAEDVTSLKRARHKPLHYRPLEEYLAERNRKGSCVAC